MNTWSIQQGGSTDLKLVTIENVVDYTGYHGSIVVIEDNASRDIVVGPIAQSADAVEGFTVGLLPEQTSNIVPGRYMVVFEISKGIDPITYRKEVSWLLEVSASLINP